MRHHPTSRPVFPLRSALSFRRTLLTLALLLWAVPALAYTVYLKDGQQIIAKSEYQVRDGKAYITLVNGTRTQIDLDEIDVEKTRKANAGAAYGSAVILEDGRTEEVPAPPRREKQEETLSDLIRKGEAGPAHVPDGAPTGRSGSSRPEAQGGPQRTETPAGYVDLLALPRRPADNEALAQTLQSAFREGQMQQVKVYQGTRPDRPLVEVTTDSESAVLRALAVGASVLHRLRERYPEDLAGLELLMVTPDRRRGGQFQLTPQQAAALLQREIDPGTFFLENVQF
jgi:hypothetical protein